MREQQKKFELIKPIVLTLISFIQMVVTKTMVFSESMLLSVTLITILMEAINNQNVTIILFARMEKLLGYGLTQVTEILHA